MEKNVNIKFNIDNTEKSLTLQEYKEILIFNLKHILIQKFPNNLIKQQIDVKYDRINISCPYCGDSLQSDYKKRGNFIFAGKFKGFFKCHNCGIFKRIDQFFKDFKTELKLDAINYLMDNIGDFHTYEGAKYDMSVMLDLEHLDKYAIDRQEFLHYFGLVEVKNSSIHPWLINRLQYKYEKFLYNPNKNYLFILNLTPSGKILGVQKRIFFGYNKFETYKLSKIYELMKKPLEVNEEQLNYLDTLSMIFNICLINFSHKIILFEGPMDAFLFENSIANTGANKELPIDLNVDFFYDYDETGNKKAIEKINNGFKIFLWGKFLKDANIPYRKKWDLNDIFIYIREKNLKVPNFNLYFSNDPLDLIDL